MKSSILTTIMLFTMLLAGLFAKAQSVEGDWEGKLDFGPTKLRVVFHITQENGEYQATMDSPDQGSYGMKASSVTLEGDQLTITSEKLQMTYVGQLSASGSLTTGTFTQRGRDFPLELTKQQTTITEQVPPAGDWKGELDMGPIQLKIVYHIRKEKEGWAANMDSPDQGVFGLPVSKTTVQDHNIEMESSRIGATFKGIYKENDNIIDGTFSQNGQDFPLVLSPSSKDDKPKRPQTPQEPFPYEAKEVKFENEEAAIFLAGTLTIPAGKGPFPAVVLVTGSGPQDRDETILNHKPFWVIADHFSRQGIAVLRFDDRGIAKSEGDFSAATSEDFATDAIAAMGFLRQQDKINPDKIGLVGHSEGGLISAIVAEKDPNLPFMVWLAGPALNGKAILQLQSRVILETSGVPSSTVDSWLEIYNKITDEILQAEDKKAAIENINEQAASYLAPLDKTSQQMLGVSEENLAEQFERMTSPWFQYFMQKDPLEAMGDTKSHLLALFGEKDVQVPARENVEALDAFMKGRSGYKSHIFKDLNHFFQQAETGLPLEYGKIEETISPNVLDMMAEWIHTQ